MLPTLVPRDDRPLKRELLSRRLQPGRVTDWKSPRSSGAGAPSTMSHGPDTVLLRRSGLAPCRGGDRSDRRRNLVSAEGKVMEQRYVLTGEVDMAVEEQIRQDLDAIVATPDVHLLIDCTDVTFMDSTGIRLLVTTHLALEEQGRHLLVLNMPPTLRKPFELLGVDHLFRYDRETVDPELGASA